MKKSPKTKYPGEKTLLNGKYPVTKNGRINCNRVRSAKAYGVMHGDLPALMNHGLGKYLKHCGVGK